MATKNWDNPQYIKNVIRLRKEREPEKYIKAKKAFALMVLLGLIFAGLIF